MEALIEPRRPLYTYGDTSADAADENFENDCSYSEV